MAEAQNPWGPAAEMLAVAPSIGLNPPFLDFSLWSPEPYDCDPRTDLDFDQKHAIACFVGGGVPLDTVEKFEDAATRARAGFGWNDYHIRPTVLQDVPSENVAEFVKFCVTKLRPGSTPYDPSSYCFLDAQTVADESVPFAHHGLDIVEQVRLTPPSLIAFVACLHVGKFSIPEIFQMYGKDADTPDLTWVYDMPFDYHEQQKNVRVATSELTRSESTLDGFVVLSMAKDKVAALGLREVDIKLVWYGEPPETILLLQSWEEVFPEKRHVIGEQRTNDDQKISRSL
ncbi:hypothetical protein OF83DRAFT_1085648 [Amylostereum chailletii]|nr:hypothetical protein OF83DRAFT_1085648 [Amylostereum chailletii]